MHYKYWGVNWHKIFVARYRNEGEIMAEMWWTFVYFVLMGARQ
jgi:hypothetical protein